MGMQQLSRFEAEAQYHDEPVSVPGPASHMPSYFWSTTRMIRWGIQYLKTKKPPKNLQTQFSAPLRIVTAGSQFNPNPLTAKAPPPATAYSGSGPVRAPAFNEGSGQGRHTCG